MSNLDQVERRLEAGERVTVIASDLGVSERTVRNWLHAAGRPLASSRLRQRRRGMLTDPTWLRQLHVDEGLSASTIAHRLGLPIAEVRSALEGFGIKRPPVHPELTAEALRAAFAAGGTVSSIARTAGVERATVRTALQRHGVRNPHADRGRRIAQLDDAQWLRARYVESGLSMRAIADELGVAEITVSRAVRRHGLPRPRGVMRPRVDIDADWLRERYEVDRVPMSTIAAEAGVCSSTIARAVRRLRLERTSMVVVRRPHPHAECPGGIDPVWLRTRYVDQGHTIAKIAREIGVSTTTVHRALTAYGLAKRAVANRSTSAV